MIEEHWGGRQYGEDRVAYLGRLWAAECLAPDALDRLLWAYGLAIWEVRDDFIEEEV